MNRTVYFFFLKNTFALFIILFCKSALATSFTAIQDGDFSLSSTWGTKGENPLTQAAAGDTIYINGKRTIYITTNINIPNLKIEDGSTLIVKTSKDITITITESLFIGASNDKTASIIDFGSGNVTFTVQNYLMGAIYSTIQKNPGTGKTQQLILKGTSNNLYQYTYSGAGTSIVTYNGTKQDVFNAGSYSYLELSGGPKTLLNPSVSGDATVLDGLTITSARLNIGSQNFNYLGTESNLKCAIGTGWIYMDEKGTYTSLQKDAARTFPVGDATSPQQITLTNIADKKISVCFTNSVPSSVPNSGLGAWYITAPTSIASTLTLINPSGTISSTSNIAIYSSSAWKIQNTTYLLNTTYKLPTYTTKDIKLTTTATAFALFTCPTFIADIASLEDANLGDTYNQNIQISGGTGSYTLASYSTNPSGVYTLKQAKTDIVNINGKPTTPKQTVVSFTSQDETGCQTTFDYTINALILSTTWDGKSWSNGTPEWNVDAVFAANCTLPAGTQTIAKNITINSGVTVTVPPSGFLKSQNSIYNNGTISCSCSSGVSYDSKFSTYTGKQPVYPTIRLSSLTYGTVGQEFSQTITSNIAASTDTYVVSSGSLPDGVSMSSSGVFSGQPIAKGSYTFTVDYKQGNCAATQSYTVPIIEAISPNLAILNIGSKTYGDDNFKVRTYSRSTGTITYSLLSGTTCAQIDPKTGEVTILDAGPSPQNVVVVKASQDAKDPYKAESVTETFIIKPAVGKFFVLNYAFVVSQSKTINVYTKLDQNPTLTFEQLTGFENATIANGIVTPKQVGTFSVHISMAPTTRYTAFDSTYTFNVITQQKPPVAVADTLVLEMGKDSTFNILENDYGMTTEIAPDKTDIDIENREIQMKFYSTELGNFLIDAKGNLTILPFAGFIGSGKLGYSVGDANGLRSEIAYVQIIVNPPSAQLEMKANTIMTPNDDNLNDALVIANTDLNKANSLIVQDHSGNIVFETVNYQNNWEGTNTKNNELEPGTYFYIFTEKTSGRELKNYIQIVK